jgi:hypothetical protein
LNLTKGAVIFAPTAPTTIVTRFGSIGVAPHSLVMVLAQHDGIAVYDFNDCHYGAVKISVGSNQYILAPGRHVLISENTKRDFEEVNAAQLFAYRGIRQHAMADGHGRAHLSVFTAEFNLAQAIKTVIPLRNLVNSKNPKARSIAKRLVKTTGIMAELTAGGEEYQQVLRPSRLAYSLKN